MAIEARTENTRNLASTICNTWSTNKECGPRGVYLHR